MGTYITEKDWVEQVNKGYNHNADGDRIEF